MALFGIYCYDVLKMLLSEAKFRIMAEDTRVVLYFVDPLLLRCSQNHDYGKCTRMVYIFCCSLANPCVVKFG